MTSCHEYLSVQGIFQNIYFVHLEGRLKFSWIELLPRNTHFSQSRMKVQCWKINWSVIFRTWRVFCYSQFEKWVKDQELDFSPVTSRRSSLDMGCGGAWPGWWVSRYMRCLSFPVLLHYWNMVRKKGQQDEDDCTRKFWLNKEQFVLCR